jgi:hypothetical protein
MTSPTYSPAVQTRHYRTLVFDPSLEIVLETEGDWKRAGEADIAAHGYVADVELEPLRQFVKGKTHTVEIKGVRINMEKRSISFHGYALSANGSRWMASPYAPDVYEIPIMFSLEKVRGVVEYFYHMFTTV